MKVVLLTYFTFTYFLDRTIAQTSILDNLNGFYRFTLQAFFPRTGSGRALQAAELLNKMQPVIDDSIPFPCETSSFRSLERPTSVHELRPGDIDVIAAMGDSLTAANGAAASRFFDITVENRGFSWSIGGQGNWRDHLTLPNILKEFNGKLMGYSLSDAFTTQKSSQFNVAEAGSMSRDMPFMAKVLVKRMRADKRVNINKDWKLVTLMIGGNDFCADICYRSNPIDAVDIHRKDLIRALDYLRDNLPRTLVNLVVPPSIDILIKFKGKKSYCEAMHILECPCIFGKARVKSQEPMKIVMRKWQQIEEDLTFDNRYRKKDDFAVVLQPFVADLIFPERVTSQGNLTDWSFLSEDCFHFSQKGYARAANAVWNNMLEPVGEKTTGWADSYSRFLCPTEDNPYFYTWKNSRQSANIRQIT